MLLLPHCTAQKVRLPETEPREYLHNLHDLLLIEYDAECFLQNRLEHRMHIDDLFFSVQTVDEVGHHTAPKRTRTIECYRRNQIDKALRLEIFDEIRHACRLHLKHSACIAIAQHL